MEPSQACYDLVEKSEAFESHPYPDPVGIPTIGYGCTHYPDGTRVTLHDAPIDEATGHAMMVAAMAPIAAQVAHYVQVKLTQNEFDALCDFAYNEGPQKLKTSTLLAKLNAHDFDGAAAEFKKWIYADGRIYQGLVTRREAERRLFLGLAQ